MFINSVSYFLIIVVSLVESHSQPCSKGLILTQRSKTSSITIIEPQEIQTCCDGYQEKKIYSWSICKPICQPNCTTGYRCVSPNTCQCLPGHKLVQGICQPTCEHQCGNGTCMSDFCFCFPGFRVNYSRYSGREDGPVCEPIRTNAITTTNNPLTAMRTSNSHGYHTEDTTMTTKHLYLRTTTDKNYKHRTEATTTTAKHPYFTMTTDKNYKYRTEATTTTAKHPYLTMTTDKNYKYRTEATTTTAKHPYLTMTTDKNYKYHTTDTTTTTMNPHIKMTTYNNYKYHTEDTTTTTKDPRITMTTHNNYKYHATDTTTTTKDPHIRMTTYNNYKYHTEDTTKTTKDPRITMTTHNNYKYHTTDTTTTPNFVINTIIDNSNSSAETVLDNDANNNVTSTDMLEKSWMEQHGMYIWIPLLLILSTALILVLIWQGVPMVIINFYKGVRNRKSYNVKGAFRKQSESGAFDSSCLEFLPDERGPQS